MLRTVRPPRVFITADGPRAHEEGETEKCERTRAVFDEIDWPCDVRRNEHAENIGLQRASLEGISWFFSQVDSGIILEDDTVIHPDFLDFSAEMLERYRDVPEVRYVCSVNMADHRRFSSDSYFFASMGQLWGWASWRDRWANIDPELSDWPNVRPRFVSPDATRFQRAIVRNFDAAHDNSRRSWVRVWNYSVVRDGGLVIIPETNMLRNIGFGPDATHTKSRRHTLARLRSKSLARPLRHPAEIKPNAKYDNELAWYRTHDFRRRVRDTLRNFKLI